MKRVLIIEDEKPLRDVYALILRQEGFQVDVAENGKIGHNKLKKFKPDLIILDMLMPVMGGAAFLRKAKLPINHPESRIIIVSNLSEPITSDESKKYGVIQSFIKVNLSPADLASNVKKYCP
jgi:DNA-binding response OmpR family regulator